MQLNLARGLAIIGLVLLLPLGQGNTNAQTNLIVAANIPHQTFPQVIVKVIGNYLYYEPYGPQDTMVYDIANPTNPVYLAHMTIPARGRSVAYLYGYLPIVVTGRYAYLASDTLSVLDISNPTNFLTVAGWHSPLPTTNDVGIASALDVAVSGSHAYLADACDGLFIFDISTPTNLVQVGHAQAPGKPTTEWSYTFGYEGAAVGVAVSGRFAFVANWLDGLRVYDVSDPTAPVNVGHVADPAYSISISGGVAYVFTAGGLLNIYGLSNPTQPVLLGQITDWALVGMAVSGNFAYVDSAFQSVSIYDVSNPALPAKIAHTDDLSGPNWYAYETYSISVSGNHLYVGLTDYGVRIYSLGTPASPELTITSTTTNTLLLSWPTPTAPFALQQTLALTPQSWATLTNTSVIAGSRNQIVLPIPSATTFYRLISD